MQMNLFVRFFLSCLFSFSYTSLIFAQASNDSLFVKIVSDSINKEYISQLMSEAPIFNGREFYPTLRLNEGGHTSFVDDNYVSGKLMYDGSEYNNVSMKYDLVINELILLNYDKVGGIVLRRNHVESFSLNNHSFINIIAGNTQERKIEPGYYDLLYNGSVQLLAKREKKIVEAINKLNVERLVESKNTYYLFKNNSYTLINGKNGLLKLLIETSQQNKKFLKTNKLNFKKDKENSFIELLRFYDLTKQ